MTIRKLLASNRISLAVLVLLVLFPFLMSLLTGQPVDQGLPKFWQGMLAQVFILAVFAMSYDLVMGYTGMLSFGHAMFFGAGAYTAGILLKHAHWSLPQVLLAVIGVAILQALLTGVLSLRVRGVYFAMVTLAFAQFFFILSEATDFKDITGADDGLHGIPVPDWLNPAASRLNFYFFALAVCVLVYLIARRVVSSPPGRVMVAIRENEQRAQMIGYNTFVYKLIAVTISGILAAVAGMMSTLWNLSVTPVVLSVGTTINALLMTIIGGVGTLIGPIVGAAVFQLLGYWLNMTFGPRWQLILGAVYILLVIFLPYGIVGTWRLRSPSLRSGWNRLLHPLELKSSPGPGKPKSQP